MKRALVAAGLTLLAGAGGGLLLLVLLTTGTTAQPDTSASDCGAGVVQAAFDTASLAGDQELYPGATPAIRKQQEATARGLLAGARQERLEPQGQVVLIMVGLVESQLMPGLTEAKSDRDSAGPLQQRRAWGSLAERMDPVSSARLFINGGHGGQRGLRDIADWQTLPAGAVAQAVQVSAFGGRYAAQEDRARRIVSASGGGSAQPAAAPATAPCVDAAPVVSAGDMKGDSAGVPCTVGGQGTVEQAPGGASIRVCTVRGIPVNTKIAANVVRMFAAADAAGVKLGGSGFRSNARQIELRREHCGGDIYSKPSGQCHPPTAIPGQSMHEWGLALDLTCQGTLIHSGDRCFSWLADHASTYGLRNLPSEAWHWSSSGR